MIWGFLLIFIGAFGTGGMMLYISNHHYTYSSPFTDHEILMLAILCIFFILLVAGVLTIIFSYVRKSNQDTLTRIQSMESKGQKAGICPSCHLNLAPGTTICPKCGHQISKEE